MNIGCDIHKFMNAKAVVLDTPYYAITDEQGKFEIKDVPAGVDVYVVAWHEEAGENGYLLPAASPSRQGEKLTLEDKKEKELNFKIKKK